MSKRYTVVREYVTLTTMTPDGARLVGFHKGALVPDDVPKEQIDRHVAKGLIAEEKVAEQVFADDPGPIPPVPQPEPPKARRG